jgi:hypothetical protein
MHTTILVCTDLMFTSKITGTGKELGVPVKVVPSVAAGISASGPEVRLALLDLANPKQTSMDDIRRWREALPTEAVLVAYGSHVEVDLLRSAREAGCNVVMVRSEFVQKLPQLFASVGAGEESGT